MNNKILLLIAFLVLAAACLAIIASLPGGVGYDLLKLLMLVISMAFVVLAFASRYYTYLMMPFIQQRRQNIILSDQAPYWLASTNDAIVSKHGTDFIATTFINIPIYVSASEMSDEEKENFAYQMSRLVGISSEPVKYSTALRIMDKESYITKIKVAISSSEVEEANLMQQSASKEQIERVRGKLAMWKKVLDHISLTTSTELVTYASISASGTKEYEAITIAQQKARDLINGIGTTLGVVPSIAVGEDILKFVEPEHLIPTSTVSEEITRRIEKGEVE